MKKLCLIFLILVLAVSLCACGRNKNTETQPGTILPDMDPTFGTNIPDPEVNTSMPMYTDGTGNTEDTNFGGDMTDNSIPGTK